MIELMLVVISAKSNYLISECVDSLWSQDVPSGERGGDGVGGAYHKKIQPGGKNIQIFQLIFIYANLRRIHKSQIKRCNIFFRTSEPRVTSSPISSHRVLCTGWTCMESWNHENVSLDDDDDDDDYETRPQDDESYKEAPTKRSICCGHFHLPVMIVTIITIAILVIMMIIIVMTTMVIVMVMIIMIIIVMATIPIVTIVMVMIFIATMS